MGILTNFLRGRLHMNKKHKAIQNTNPKYRIVTQENPTSVISECYRRIKVSLSFANVDKHLQVVGITSAVQGEGKTLTILNLASAYVEDGNKVLVLDLDLRRPKLHKHLGVENVNGIAEVCSGAIELKDSIRHSKYGFDIINSGKKTNFPMALLGSKKMEEVIEELKGQYDVILVDCAPVVPVSDAIVISKFCDGLLFVVSQRVKEKTAAIEGVNTLKANKVNLLGCIFTCVDVSGKDYYYSNKYKYYHYHYYARSVSNQINEIEDNKESEN